MLQDSHVIGPRTAIGRGAVAVLLAFLAVNPCLGEPGTQVVESEHYRLSWQGERAEAEEMSRVLEAAWAGFKEFFQAVPDVKEGEKLVAGFYHDSELWADAIRKDGGAPPTGGGGYYWPTSKAVYLYRQPTRYYTRCLLIHEVCHQFHYLSRTGNRNPKAPWYIEGVVEHLAWHWWDGKNLKLGVVPLSLKDYPAKSLEALERGEIDLKSMIEGKEHRPLGSMLVRYLLEGEGCRLRGHYEALARKLDKGGDSKKSFLSVLGDPAVLQPRFLAWLQKAQEPWTPVFNEWERVSQDRFIGYAEGVVSACRVKGAVSVLEAVLEVPDEGPWKGGVLLHFEDLKNYTLALAYGPGEIRVNRMTGGKWRNLHRGPCPKPAENGLLRFRASRDGKRVVLVVEGTEVGAFDLPGASLGLALDNCRLRFRDVKWTMAGAK